MMMTCAWAYETLRDSAAILSHFDAWSPLLVPCTTGHTCKHNKPMRLWGGCTKCCTWRCSAVAWLRQLTWAAQIPGARRIFCSRGNPPGGGQRLRLRLACCPGSIRAELHPPHPAGGDKLVTGRDIVSSSARRTLLGHKPFPIRGHARPLVSAQVRCLSCAEFCRTLQLP